MSFVSIRDVRKSCGHISNFNRGVKIGTGDASNKKFYISKGNYIVDGDGDGIISLGNDIVVYVDGTEVTIDYIIPERAIVVLATAPASNRVVTCDYFSSDIADSEILYEIELEQKALETETHTKYTRDNSYTQYWNGDGESTLLFFERLPVYSIVSYNIDDVTSGLTENTDYWLYPRDNYYDSMELLTPPVTGRKNIQITYLYGEENALAYKYILYSSARTLVLHELALKGFKGVYQLPGKEQTYPTDNKAFTLFKSLDTLLSEVKSKISYKMGMELV